MTENDPLGTAIWDYHTGQAVGDIVVSSDLVDDDIIPLKHLFRSYKDFPKREQIAMKYCNGKILDIGAAAGPHTKYLLQQKQDVSTLEISMGAHNYLKTVLPEVKHYFSSIWDFKEEKFDTLLLLMNGIGMAGNMHQVTPFLKHLSSLLAPGGKIICDSTDVKYLYQDDEGGMWIDLSAEYYGNFKFNMTYKNIETNWFDWVYVDLESFEKCAQEASLNLKVLESDDYSFLVELKKKV